MVQGFKNNKKPGNQSLQTRKNKPQQRKALTLSQKQKKKLTAQINANIEQVCVDKVYQTKQHLNVVKISDKSKPIRK